MATLIPNITYTEFHALKAAELKRLKSCEVTSNGEYLFTFINAQSDFIRVQTEYKGQLSNAVRGETVQDIVGKVPV